MSQSAAPSPYRSGHSGIYLLLIAVMLFVTMDTLVKYMVQTYPVTQVVWARFFFNFLLLLPFFLMRVNRNKIKTRKPALQLGRSVMLFLTTLLFFTALTKMPLADATAAFFASPLIVTVLSVFLLGEKVGIRRSIGVAVGFIGVLVILRPGFGELSWFALLPLIGAAIYAFYQIATRQLSAYDSAMTTFFYTPLLGAIVFSVAAPFDWLWPDALGWLMMIACGALGGSGHYILIKAFERTEASLLAQYYYTNLIWATLSGWLVFNQLPDAYTIGGAILVVLSGIYILHRERLRSRQRLAAAATIEPI